MFVATGLRLIERRQRYADNQLFVVYPSFVQMHKFAMLSASKRLSEVGVRKVRQVGHTMEFDRIRNFVQGDDIRSINWRATARRAELMVNQYDDERSQYVYAVLDKGRQMKMPFNEMTLLDYAINSSLVLCNTAITKQDRAGLITFAEDLQTFVPASNRPGQMGRIQDALYNQSTSFLESNFELLYSNLRRRITRRGLLLLFTNFETVAGVRRALPALIRLAKLHLLVVVIFRNEKLDEMLTIQPRNTEEGYIKSAAERFVLEKQLIVQELNKNGIQVIYTKPEDLTVNSLNKYLELKSRGLI
jgi:uncharacterized protein (DUF58 family)